jgi:hypothetical protein
MVYRRVTETLQGIYKHLREQRRKTWEKPFLSHVDQLAFGFEICHCSCLRLWPLWTLFALDGQLK